MELTNLGVSGGAITVPANTTTAWVGLPYTCDFEALDVAQEAARQKIVKEGVLSIEALDGLWIGESLLDMTGFGRWPATTPASAFTSTGTARVTISARWGLGGRVALQQRSAFPVTITAIEREVSGGGV